MPIAHNSTSYPTLGALNWYYGGKPVPADVQRAAYGFAATVVDNLRHGRRPIDLNHITYALCRSFDVLPRELAGRLVENAISAHRWCLDDKAEKERQRVIAAQDAADARVGNQAGWGP